MKEQIERILADADYPETKLEKTVSINFDGRQYFIRIPKKLSDYLKLTSTNKIKITIDIPYIDKVFHIGEYAFFSFLLARALAAGKKPENKIIFWGTVFLLACAWGIIDEFHQSFVITRQASIFDVFADCIGAGLGQFLIIK